LKGSWILFWENKNEGDKKMKGGYLRLIRAMGSWVITGTSDKLDYKRMDMGVNPSVC